MICPEVLYCKNSVPAENGQYKRLDDITEFYCSLHFPQSSRADNGTNNLETVLFETLTWGQPQLGWNCKTVGWDGWMFHFNRFTRRGQTATRCRPDRRWPWSPTCCTAIRPTFPIRSSTIRTASSRRTCAAATPSATCRSAPAPGTASVRPLTYSRT